jgi:hypothetical protein
LGRTFLLISVDVRRGGEEKTTDRDRRKCQHRLVGPDERQNTPPWRRTQAL